MAEVEQRVEAYIVNYWCDKCGKGLMGPTGAVSLVETWTFEHKCENKECGEVKNLTATYPIERKEYVLIYAEPVYSGPKPVDPYKR